MSRYKPPESNDSPDLTPMIDVVFLLIVFFMVVAQRMSEQYIALPTLSLLPPMLKRFRTASSAHNYQYR